MALPGTLYRFTLDVSDTDRNVYENIELRVVQHPSESEPYLCARIIAYALNLQEGLSMSKAGLAQPDEPALFVDDLTGARHLWIEVGCPSAERLHKASKAAEHVLVYTHKTATGWVEQLKTKTIYQPETVHLYEIPPTSLAQLSSTLQRNNHWDLVHTEGQIYLTTQNQTFEILLVHHKLA